MNIFLMISKFKSYCIQQLNRKSAGKWFGSISIVFIDYYKRHTPAKIKKLVPRKMAILIMKYIRLICDVPVKDIDPKLVNAIFKADKAVNNKNWLLASKCWQNILNEIGDFHSLTGRAKLNISVSSRMADIESYREQIKKYNESRYLKNSAYKKAVKICVYTAIAGNYDSIKLPEKLDTRIDYILFSDRDSPNTGVWQVRPMTFFHEDATRMARYVKTHPHMLLADYDITIWIDSNIMMLGSIYPLIGNFLFSGKRVAAVPHPLRESLYDEVVACSRFKKENLNIMLKQVKNYKQEGFSHNDLIESNLLMFDSRSNDTKHFLNTWWAEIDKYSKRDQLSLNYSLQKTGLQWYPLMKRPDNTRNHPQFAYVSHDGSYGAASKLIDALNSPLVNPYEGATYDTVKEDRIVRHKYRKIDIVVCVHNALNHVKSCLNSVASARNSENVNLLIIDDGSNESTANYLEEFSNKRNWVELHRNDCALGYTKAANQGLVKSSGELVILLNSDTIVTDSWVEKLADAVFETPGAGIVGPMSNAASHQSIPDHISSQRQTAINDLPSGLSPEDMNRYCEKWTTVDVLPRVPLVHGFCFGIARDVLKKIGLFDEIKYPHGYGEENDYCFRAIEAGFSLVVATHTYIYHAKSKSYSNTARVPLMDQGSKALAQSYGELRVERAVKSMQNNFMFMRLRDLAKALVKDSL